MKNNQPPQAAHQAITTARRPDNTRSSARVRSQSTKFMTNPRRELRSRCSEIGSHFHCFPAVFLILVLPSHSSQSSDSARILTYLPFGYLLISKPIYADFCMHFSFRQKQRDINGQRFARCFPLHPPFWPCWTIFVGSISLVKWTGVQPVALRLGVIVIAPFQI